MDAFAVFAIGLLLALAALGPALWIKYVLGRQLGASQQELRDQARHWEGETLEARLTTDERGSITGCNRAAAELFRCPAEQMVHRPVSGLLPETAGRAAVATPALADTGVAVVETTGERKDGTYFPLEVRIRPARAGFRMVLRDLTAQQQGERQAREAQLLDGILRSMAAPLLILNRDGGVVRLNAAFTALTGFAPSDALERYYWELLLPEEEWPLAKVLIGQLLPGNGLRQGKARWRTRGEAEIPVQLGMSAVRSANQPVEFLAVVAMEQSAEAPPEVMEALERLAGGVARQFNELLTSINGYSELMLHSMDPADPQRRDAERILEAGGRAARLTARLLAFSRQQPLRPAMLHLNGLIQKIRPDLEALLGERIELATTLDLALHPLRADAGWIEQVVLQLAANARDAMPDGGKLTIETGNIALDDAGGQRATGLEAGDYVMLLVRDTGRGLDPESRRHLFQPFFTTKTAGLGLGLSTVYGVVRQSGGGVVVESTPQGGTAVRVYLPRHQEAGSELCQGKLFLMRGAGA